VILLDTHAWLWYVSDPQSLSKTAAAEIAKGERIGISAISCFEVATAVVKGRIRLDRSILDWLETALSLPRTELLPITPAVSVKATQLGAEFHGDPADRIIVATAILESASLITKDSRIQKYPGVPTIW
jgi:PIN domain nuclease of toxin-antitoxin system